MNQNKFTRIYTFELQGQTGSDAYDEAVTVAVAQGIFNRSSHDSRLYLTSRSNPRPEYWLNLFSQKGEWLSPRTIVPVSGMQELVELVRPYLREVIIYDETVPATLNVATTIAGVENGIVLSPSSLSEMLPQFGGLPVVDLRGKFTGAESGSAKNDAYRWAVRQYLQKGKCSHHFMSLFEDSALARNRGDLGYAVTRDWAVYQRSFVYDLSPWGDEVPGDDPAQKIGTDLETYRMILQAQSKQTDGKELTEVSGFFCFDKYAHTAHHESIHEDVATEWENVYLISPYNCYQNTVAQHCYNQSVHSQFVFHPVKQEHCVLGKSKAIEKKCYLCFHMGDYDSTTPLYDTFPRTWNESPRGHYPLAWAINPNLIETYPDIIDYAYRTKTNNDFFVADACGAGYFNPSRLSSEQWPLMTEHNRIFFSMMNLSIAPMVLDFEAPNRLTEQNFAQFSPDGFATCVIDQHHTGAKTPQPYVTPEDMIVDELYVPASHCSSPRETAEHMIWALENDHACEPCFHYIRIVWESAERIEKAMVELKQLRPDLDFEILDPYTYFAMHRRFLQNAKP